MAGRRLLYALVLLGALAFQIFNTVYLAHFLLALVLCLPFLALAVSLPAMLRCRVWIEGHDALRAEPAYFQVRVSIPSRLPVGRLSVRLRQENTMTGVGTNRRVVLTGAADGAVFTVSADTAHCGRLRCGGRRAKVCDCLGLFALPRPVLEASALVLPRQAPPQRLPEPAPDQQTGPTPCPRTGRRGEDYELRPYRPGDPMRQVHWKLSAKQQDDLVVREMLEDRVPTVVVLFDRGGAAQAVDHRLDRLDTLCRTLLAKERSFHVLFRDGEQTVSHPVGNEHQLYGLMAALLSRPTPPELASMPPCRPAGLTGPVQFCHITEGEEDDPWNNLPPSVAPIAPQG